MDFSKVMKNATKVLPTPTKATVPVHVDLIAAEPIAGTACETAASFVMPAPQAAILTALKTAPMLPIQYAEMEAPPDTKPATMAI